MKKNNNTTCRFADFGQCNNLAEREGSSWWTEHTRSFAMRQMGMFEREMGWSFWTWKLEDQLGGFVFVDLLLHIHAAVD